MAENTENTENNSNWDMGSLFGGEDQLTETSESGSGEENEKQEIPIIDKEEAIRFGMRELGKIMRDDGHQIELKVIGNINYRVGAWIRTYIPSFGEDGMFFISKAQQEASADSEWITSLTLVDYPPSLSKGESNTSSGNSSSNDSEDEDSSSEDEGNENEESQSTENGNESQQTPVNY